MNKTLLYIGAFLLCLSLVNAVESYPDNLMYLYKFNNQSSDGTNAYDSINDIEITGTSISGSEWIESSWNSSFGKAIELDGSADYFTSTTTPPTEFSIQILTCSHIDGSGFPTILSSQDGGNSEGIIMRMDSDDKMHCYSGTGATYVTAVSDSEIEPNTCNFITCIWNATGVYLYNGSVLASTSGSGGVVSSATDLLIGKPTGAELIWNGEISLVRIWNKTLSQEEIINYSASEIEVIIPFLPSGDITINYPSNFSYQAGLGDIDVDVIFTTIGTNESYDCTLYVDKGAGFSQKDSVVAINDSLAELEYDLSANPSQQLVGYYVECENHNLTSTIYNMTIDYTSPIVVNYLEDEIIINNQSINVTFNLTETNIGYCVYNWTNGTTYQANPTTSGIYGEFFNNFYGEYNWNVKCWDLANNTGESAITNFLIDINSPVVTTIYPPNESIILIHNGDITPFSMVFRDYEGFIYTAQYNITNCSGLIYHNESYTDNGSRVNSIYTFNNNVVLDGGAYCVDTFYCDGHTDKNIEDIKITIEDKELDFESFIIKPKDKVNIKSITTEKLGDRYAFEWELNSLKKTEFDLISNYKLTYMINSDYQAHFIFYDKATSTYRWVDFEGLDNIEVIKINDYHYVVSTIPKDIQIIAKSTGELNCINEQYNFYLQEVIDESGIDKINNLGTFLADNIGTIFALLLLFGALFIGGIVYFSDN